MIEHVFPSLAATFVIGAIFSLSPMAQSGLGIVRRVNSAGIRRSKFSRFKEWRVGARAVVLKGAQLPPGCKD